MLLLNRWSSFVSEKSRCKYCPGNSHDNHRLLYLIALGLLGFAMPLGLGVPKPRDGLVE